MDDRELQARLLYSVVVAGKSADFANNVIVRLLGSCQDGELPFAMLRRKGSEIEIRGMCRSQGTGNYTKVGRCFWELSQVPIDLRTCTAEDLERFHGIGPKTSRFFIMWTRPEAIHAALDVHVLRWMRGLGYHAPKSTPTGSKYAKLEVAFIAEAAKRGLTPRELDSQIWDAARKGAGNEVRSA